MHYDNIHAEQLDYELRKMYGIKFPRMLISFTHDGMAKNKLRLPHLNINRSKILSDVDLAYCNLNSLLIHRKNEEGGNCIIDGYFNLGESFPGGANSVISQIITSLTQCTPIPPILTIQLDNCSSNKCYAVIGAFAWLLQHQTAVKEVYLCYNEVGHTHIDVDGFFGRFATLLDRTECFSPQDMFGLLLRQKGVRQAAYCLKIYDFTAMLLPHLNKFGNLKNNHMFRVYLTADKIPKVQIAPFIRSSKWLKGVPDAEIYDTDVFTTQPELDKMPEPMKCDYGKLESLLHVASKAKELLTKNQLQNYHHIVNLLKNSVAKPFVEIIETLNANGIATHQDVASSGNR
uniref:DUF7869 domain-containing protein n=1 Tax=Panagrolaimus superbus TaxID=310955 RepID=A0A914XYE0_9BILA